MTPKLIFTAFTRLKNQNPKPTTELIYSSKFELLISVMLSAQSTDHSVNRVTEKLYGIANTPQSIMKIGVAKLKQCIKTVGLCNSKAENVIATCKILIENHDGEVPNTRTELETLPGVGRKTANVMLNTAFGQPTIAVDRHVFRVSNRTGIALGKDVISVEKVLLQSVPDRFKAHAHHWLILLGRYTCLARNPKCDQCILNDICDSAAIVQR